jgi:hypothetical protein
MIKQVDCTAFLQVFTDSIVRDCTHICLPPEVKSDMPLLREAYIEYAEAHPGELARADNRPLGDAQLYHNALQSRWPCR